MNKETFCSLPFTGLFLGSDGGLRPCCSLRGNLGNINENTVEEILNGSVAKSIRSSIIKNEWHPMCSQCQELESRGASTERIGTLWRLDDLQKVDESFFRLEKIDLRWSNTCNLSCNYCFEYFSSKWAELKGIKVNSNKEEAEYKVFSFVQDNLASISSVNLLGGEPLLQKPNIKLLDILPSNMHIYILTNLTVPLEKNPVAQKLMEKPCAGWGISFESIGDKFEHVRHGAQWDIVLKNLRMLGKIATRVNIHPIFCVYSAFNLVELYDFLDNEGYFATVHWQVLQNIKGLDVFCMPYPLKLRALNEIEMVFEKYGGKYDMQLLQNIYDSLKESLHKEYFTSEEIYSWWYRLEKTHPGKKEEFINLYSHILPDIENTRHWITTKEGTEVVRDENNVPVYSAVVKNI